MRRRPREQPHYNYKPIKENPLVNFLLNNKKVWWDSSTKELIAAQDPETYKNYLLQELPIKKELSENWRILHTRKFTVWKMFWEHFFIWNLKKIENRERVFNIDTLYKIALQEFLKDYNRNFNTLVHWNPKKSLAAPLKLQEFSKNTEAHPYNTNTFRKWTLDPLKELIGKNEYSNIANRFLTKIKNHITITENKKIPEIIYKYINWIHKDNLLDMLRIEITELLVKELIQHLLITQESVLKKQLSNNRRSVKAIRVYKTNKVVDMINQVDLIISVEYVHNTKENQWQYESTDALLLDLKVDWWIGYRLDSVVQKQSWKKILTQQWVYSFYESDIAKELTNSLTIWQQEFSSLANIDKDTQERRSAQIENKAIKVLDWISNIIERLNADISFYIFDDSETETYIDKNIRLLDKLENDIMDDPSPSSITYALKDFEQSMHYIYNGIDISFPLWTNKSNVIKRNLHIGRKSMSKLFDIAFENIKKYGKIDHTNPEVQAWFKKVTAIAFKDKGKELFTLLQSA